MTSRRELLADILWELNNDVESRTTYVNEPEKTLRQFGLSGEEIKDFMKTVMVQDDIRVKVGGPWFKACTA